MTTPQAPARTVALETLQEYAPFATAMVETVRGLDVPVDAETCAVVADVRKRIGEADRKLTAKKKAITDPLSKAVREINALFKPSEDALEEALKLTKQKLDTYAHNQLVIESERQAAARREAVEQQARDQAAADALRASGANDTAELVEVRAAAAVALASGAAKVETVRGEDVTFSVKRHWEGRVLDVRAFCAAVGRGQIPVECVNVNLRSLNDHAKALGTPLVAADPSALNKVYIEQGFAIALVAEGMTR